jgi:hypothetical protein
MVLRTYIKRAIPSIPSVSATTSLLVLQTPMKRAIPSVPTGTGMSPRKVEAIGAHVANLRLVGRKTRLGFDAANWHYYCH